MDLHTILVTFHLVGFAFGIGGATSSDLVFLRSIKNGSISKDQYDVMKTLSRVVWASVVLLLVSGAALLALQQYQTGSVPRFEWSFFQLKLTAFAFVVANGTAFHYLVFPLVKKSTGKSFRTAAMKRRYPLFALTGAISIVSWYTAFLMVAFGRFFIDYSYVVLLSGYIAAIGAAAVGAYSTIWLYASNKGPLIDKAERIVIRGILIVLLFVLLASAYILFFT